MIPSHFPRVPNDWETLRSEVKSPVDGLNLSIITWKKKTGPIKNVLQLSHGLGEHGGRYEHFPHFLHSCFDVVTVSDHRGHGLSGGKRGDIHQFQDYLTDLIEVRKSWVNQWKTANIHLLGHSLGGLIALRSTQAFPEVSWSSLIVSSPLVAMKVQVPWIKKTAAFLLKDVLGGLQLASGLDPTHLSRDAELVRCYKNDPLNHDKVTPRLFIGMLNEMQELQTKASMIPKELPVMAVLPLADLITDTAVALKFLEALPNVKKSVTCLEGFYHESFNELEKEKAFGDVAQWLKTLNRAG